MQSGIDVESHSHDLVVDYIPRWFTCSQTLTH